MPITYPVIQHTWQNADQTACSGEITFTLSSPITNGSVTIAATRVTAMLDNNGSISQPLASNVDAGTVPQTSYWIVSERIMGAAESTWSAQVPSASAAGMPVELGTLAPFVVAPEFG